MTKQQQQMSCRSVCAPTELGLIAFFTCDTCNSDFHGLGHGAYLFWGWSTGVSSACKCLTMMGLYTMSTRSHALFPFPGKCPETVPQQNRSTADQAQRLITLNLGDGKCYFSTGDIVHLVGGKETELGPPKHDSIHSCSLCLLGMRRVGILTASVSSLSSIL